jgi:hypothetical protein
MLELQDRGHETYKLRLGRSTKSRIIRSLGSWTTAEHRRVAKHDIVFHSADIAPAVEETRAKAKAFVEDIEKRLNRPRPHAFHPFWVGSVLAFKRMRKAEGFSSSPPELAEIPVMRILQYGMRQLVETWISQVRRRVLGQMPLVTPLHPAWLDVTHLRDTLAQVFAAESANLLLVRDPSDATERLLDPSWPAVAVTPKELAARSKPLDDHPFTHALIFVRPENMSKLGRLVRACQSVIGASGRELYIFIHSPITVLDASHFYWLAEHPDLLSSNAQELSYLFTGGRLRQFAMRLQAHLRRHLLLFGPLALLWVLPVLPIASVLALLGNLAGRRTFPVQEAISRCTSVLLRIRLKSAPGTVR